MDLDKIRVEKIALLLLLSLIMVLFLDYAFNISQIIKHYYPEISIDLKQRSRLVMLIAISLVPIMGFISLTSFKKENADILLDTLLPFLTFVFVQLILFLSIFQFLMSIFAYFLQKVSKMNQWLKSVLGI
jgi:hypothetical protein